MEQLLPQDVVDVIGDVVTHLMAEEEHPKKKSGPVVEEITEPGEEMTHEKEESDDGLDDLPDLECTVCFVTFSIDYVNHEHRFTAFQLQYCSSVTFFAQISMNRISIELFSQLYGECT